MERYSDRAKRQHDAIRTILLKDWDPIGIAQVPEAQDEYDAYVPEIYRLLVRHETESALFDYLWKIETKNMQLCANRQHTEKVASKLIALLQQIDQ